jgi:signal transduction histidine kinase
VVDDLLTTTELDRGATQLELTPVVVGDRAETLVSRLPPSDRSRVALDAGDGSTVVTDAAAVDRIVGELVGNALKHTKGTVQVRVSALPTAVCVTVTDQGPGIGPQDHARVFERFGRLGDHLHRAQGPGLGLAIVRGLADELGGRVELDSGVDRGSTFTLTLPVPEPTTPALRPPLSVVH